MEKQQNKALDRYLSKTDVWAMAFGCTVGWGVFAMPGNTFLPIAGPFGSSIALGIGMFVMLIIGNNFAFFMQQTSITGGVYSYTKAAFGRDHAFLSSWFLCLSYLTIVFLNGTALFYIIRLLLNDSLQVGLHYTLAGNTIYLGEALFSAMLLALVGVLFIKAKPLLQRLNTLLAVLLIGGVVITAVFCLPSAIKNGALISFGTMGINRFYAIFSIIILAPWAFVGFEVISFDTAHFVFSIKKTGKLIVISILATAFAYISMNLIAVAAIPEGFSSWQEYILGLDELKGVSSVPTFFAAESIMGKAGLLIMVITALSAILTGIIGGYRATTRILSTMAEDRILSEKFLDTGYSIFFIMTISIVLSFLGRNTLNWFVDLTSFGAIVGLGYTSAAAWKIAQAQGNKRASLTGKLGAILSIIFAIVQLVPRLSAMEAMGSEAFLLLALWCLLGFVFYWRTIMNSSLSEYSDMSVSGTVLFALLIYASIMWLGKSLAEAKDMAQVRKILGYGGGILLLIIFVGLLVMLYVQKLVRRKHEAAEREKIRAVEGSLAKSRFLFNMSHDIRTPMNAIIGYTDLALKEASSDTLHDYLEKISLSSRHLLELINDILEMSRIESGKLDLEYTPCDLCGIFEGIHDLFSEQMKQKEMNFSMHTSQITDRYVWVDRKNLNRVLINVIGNAYKFTPEKGTITVTLYEKPEVEDGYGFYEMHIQDNGIGMSKEFAEKMFNAFERERTSTDSGVEGTGLGLSITKSIIELMGGTIEVLTAPGNGTQIILSLKLKLASKEEVPVEDVVEHEETKKTDFSGKRVLLVEDNAINMEIAKMILSQMGFEIDTAENGKIAVDKLSLSDAGYYDAILMDIQMPVMDGYTATKQIRLLSDERKASVPIIAMTANAFAEDVQMAKECGMNGHIAKPIDVNVMISVLSEVLK